MHPEQAAPPPQILPEIRAESDGQPVAGDRLQEASFQLTRTAVLAADDRKATNIVILAVGESSDLADYFVIATGQSRAQARAIASAVRERVATEWERWPLRVSGEQEGSWVLMDYGDVIVHILLPQERNYYNLEAFWGHVPRYTLAPV
ncbi:MAG: ribosome silencing factor [Pseudanabaenaceae cyanobacterium]